MPYFAPGQKFIGTRLSTAVAGDPSNVQIASGVAPLLFQGFDTVAFDSMNAAVLPDTIRVPDGVQVVQYSASIYFHANITGVRFGQIGLSVLGNTYSFATIQAVTTAGQITRVALPTMISRINGVGQDIQLFVYQNSGGLLRVAASLTVQMFY